MPRLLTVAELLPGFGSVTSAGGVTVAVFTSTPLVPGCTVPVIVKTAAAPRATDTNVSTTFAPLAAAQAAAPLAVQVQVTPLSAAGTTSCTCALVTSLGPAFETVTV